MRRVSCGDYCGRRCQKQHSRQRGDSHGGHCKPVPLLLVADRSRLTNPQTCAVRGLGVRGRCLGAPIPSEPTAACACAACSGNTLHTLAIGGALVSALTRLGFISTPGGRRRRRHRRVRGADGGAAVDGGQALCILGLGLSLVIPRVTIKEAACRSAPHARCVACFTS